MMYRLLNLGILYNLAYICFNIKNWHLVGVQYRKLCILKHLCNLYNLVYKVKHKMFHFHKSLLQVNSLYHLKLCLMKHHKLHMLGNQYMSHKYRNNFDTFELRQHNKYHQDIRCDRSKCQDEKLDMQEDSNVTLSSSN